MKKIKYLRVQLKNEISEVEIPYFRAAIIAQVPPENILFHNHLGEGYRYAYPLIQYKRIHRKAALVCIDQGAEQIFDLFQKKINTLQIGNRTMPLEIENLYLREINFQVWQNCFPFRLQRWMPFNDKNYEAFHQLKTVDEQQLMLQRILRGNLLAMAKGIGCWLDQEVIAKITHIHRNRLSTHKSYQAEVFDLEFKTNLILPDYLGIGKRAGMGFGTVSAASKNTSNNHHNLPNPTYAL